MSNSYRILMVEDVPVEAELTGYYLRRAGMDCEIRRVESRPTFEAAIQEFSPAAILCDFSLPTFSGLEALDIARDASPSTPFIFFSGSIPRTQAEKAKVEGATAVVLKGKYEELVAVLWRALHTH